MIDPIDERVVNLVEALNDLPAVWTFGSCGGHVEVTDPCQVPEGEFYVSFAVDPVRKGWASLEQIVQACWTDEFGELAIVKAWPNGDCLCFDLRGDGDPDLLAGLITNALFVKTDN